jgi:hypothetical protein
MQYTEHNHIINILQRHRIIDYYRYVDNILIIYNEDYINIDDTLKEFNFIHPNIQYTMEKHINNKQSYLDITIENTHNIFTFNINRKPTTTDLIIHNDSCHPTEHKNAAIRYLTNRMNTYPISTNNKYQEIQHIKTILKSNNYPLHTYLSIKQNRTEPELSTKVSDQLTQHTKDKVT